MRIKIYFTQLSDNVYEVRVFDNQKDWGDDYIGFIIRYTDVDEVEIRLAQGRIYINGYRLVLEELKKMGIKTVWYNRGKKKNRFVEISLVDNEMFRPHIVSDDKYVNKEIPTSFVIERNP